jgi:hypothetical protein
VTSFAQITSDPQVQAALKEAYGNVNNIDLWVGAMAEDHLRGSSVGPLVQRILADQFTRLRDGDRFWYERSLSGPQLHQLQNTRLSDIIERNTGVTSLQDNVFFFQAQVSGTVILDANADGVQQTRRGEGPLAGATLELLNDEGEVVATTRTGRDGRYQFDKFGETGDYQVRLVASSTQRVTTENPQAILISQGGVSLRGLDFGVTNITKPPGTPTKPTPFSGGFDIHVIFSGLTASQPASSSRRPRNGSR